MSPSSPWRRCWAVRRSGRTICVPRRSSPRITRKSRAGRSRRLATITPRASGGKPSATLSSTGLEAEVAVSNQTLKADEANYRQALAMIAEARAGLFPTSEFQSVADARPRGEPSHFARRPGLRELDARRLGQGAADHRGEGRRRAGQRRRSSPMRRCPRNRRWRSPMCSFAKPNSMHDLYADTVAAISALAADHAKPVRRRHRRQIRRHHRAGAIARRAGAGDRHRRRARAERTRDRGADGPPAGGIVGAARAACAGRSRHSRRSALDPAGAPARHRRAPSARWPSRTRRSASRSPAIIPTSRFRAPPAIRQSVHQADRRRESRLVLWARRSRSRCSTAA